MELIGVYAASRLLGVTPPTVYKWLRQGVLQAHRDTITGRVYVELKEVERLVPAGRIVPLHHIQKADETGGGGAKGDEKNEAKL